MKKIIMLGTDWSSPGGITAVIHSYKQGGLFSDWPIYFLPTYRSANPVNKIYMALRALLILLILLITRKVAIVHAHSASRASFWRKSSLLIIAHLFGAKTVFHLHSGEFADFYYQECSSLKQKYIRYFLRKVDCVVVLTEKWQRILKEIEPLSAPVVLANPIALNNQATDVVPYRILFLGRLRQKKGVYDLVHSIAMLVDKYPGIQLVLAGDGEIEQVQSLVNELGLEKNIALTGWISGADKDRELACADLFILPSYFEGLPVCILEAMAWNIPVIASDVGGIPDICRDGIDGILIRAGDVNGIAASIDRVFANKALRESLVVSAKKRVLQEFEMTVVLGKLGDIYSQLDSKRELK